MSSRIQTTIDPAQSTVLLLSPDSVFTTQLKIAIQAVHLEAIVVDPVDIQKKLLQQSGRDLFKNAYVCLWIDLPIFTPQREKEGRISETLSVLQKSLAVPLHILTFDACYERENGREGDIPTVASKKLVETVLKAFPNASFFSYVHVIYPYEQGASIVSRFLLEKISRATRTPLEGSWTPLWYEDVISHTVSTLYDLETKGGVFTGRESLTIESFESSLRKLSHLPGLAGESVRFPFRFEEGTGIGQTQVSTMLEELSLITPHPSEEQLPIATIPHPVFAKRESRSKRHRHEAKIHSLLKVTGAISGTIFVTYCITAIVFFALLGSIRMTITDVVQQHSVSAWDSKTIREVNQKVNILERVATFMPFPYSLVGIALPQEGVVDGLRSVSHLSAGIQSYHEANEFLGEQLQRTANLSSPDLDSFQQISSLLDESYKDLSVIQADITRGNLIFDSLFGIDGLSSQLVSSTISLRELITQEKAVASFAQSVLSKPGKSVFILVGVDSNESRPLFGTPTEVSVITLDQGKIVSTQEYSTEELDLLLKGKVEAPGDMKKFTLNREWKISDGSWSADGPTAAREIAWFLSKQLHVEAENIVFVDTRYLSGVFDQNGDKNSVVLGAQTPHTQLAELLSNVKDSQVNVFEGALPGFIESLNSSKTVLFSRDVGVAKTVKALAWDGGVRTPSCPAVFAVDKQCQVSTRYLSEYDLGGEEGETIPAQKNNQVHQIHISKDGVFHSDFVSYHPSKRINERKLLKYLIDDSASHVSVSVNGIVLGTDDIQIGKEYEKTAVTIPVLLSTSLETTIQLSYSTPPIEDRSMSLAFFSQKQPGKNADPFTLEFSFSKDYNPTSIAPKGIVNRSGVSFTTTLDTSKIFAVGF